MSAAVEYKQTTYLTKKRSTTTGQSLCLYWWLWVGICLAVKPFQPSVAFHIETSQLCVSGVRNVSFSENFAYVLNGWSLKYRYINDDLIENFTLWGFNLTIFDLMLTIWIICITQYFYVKMLHNQGTVLTLSCIMLIYGQTYFKSLTMCKIFKSMFGHFSILDINELMVSGRILFLTHFKIGIKSVQTRIFRGTGTRYWEAKE